MVSLFIGSAFTSTTAQQQLNVRKEDKIEEKQDRKQHRLNAAKHKLDKKEDKEDRKQHKMDEKVRKTHAPKKPGDLQTGKDNTPQ